MRSPDDIRQMVGRLEDSIRSVGWSAELEGAVLALAWALGVPHAEQQLRRFLDASEGERRRDWIARGGNPDLWPHIDS